MLSVFYKRLYCKWYVHLLASFAYHSLFPPILKGLPSSPVRHPISSVHEEHVRDSPAKSLLHFLAP